MFRTSRLCDRKSCPDQRTATRKCSSRTTTSHTERPSSSSGRSCCSIGSSATAAALSRLRRVSGSQSRRSIGTFPTPRKAGSPLRVDSARRLVSSKLLVTATTGTLLLAPTLGCRVFERGPSDEQVLAAVRSAPPAPPTIGPTYLADIDAIQVEERGRYKSDGAYWPVRVRVKGSAKIRVTNVFQLGLLGDRIKEKGRSVEFVEEARFAKDDFGNWRVAYSYAADGPRWRLEEPAKPVDSK